MRYSAFKGDGKVDDKGRVTKMNIKSARFFNGVLASVLTIFLFTGCTGSQDSRTQLGTVPEFHPELGLGVLEGYIAEEELPDSLILIPPPPPVPGSAAFAADEEIARKTFALRNTPRFDLAASDFDLRFPVFVSHFSCALDAEITEEAAPYLHNLLRRSFSNLALSTYAAKNYYQRKRPFQFNNEPIAVPDMKSALENDPSYPSGHSALGWGIALILAEVAPDRADELIARGPSTPRVAWLPTTIGTAT